METSHKANAYCNTETVKATEKEEDLEAQRASISPSLDRQLQGQTRWTVTSWNCRRILVFTAQQLKMDTMLADENTRHGVDNLEQRFAGASGGNFMEHPSFCNPVLLKSTRSWPEQGRPPLDFAR